VLPRQRVGDLRHHPHTMAADPQTILRNKPDTTPGRMGDDVSAKARPPAASGYPDGTYPDATRLRHPAGRDRCGGARAAEPASRPHRDRGPSHCTSVRHRSVTLCHRRLTIGSSFGARFGPLPPTRDTPSMSISGISGIGAIPVGQQTPARTPSAPVQTGAASPAQSAAADPAQRAGSAHHHPHGAAPAPTADAVAPNTASDGSAGIDIVA
jgi:hypothetical protein